MSCHNGHGAKKVLTALRNVDDSIKEKDSTFWHKTLGTHKGGHGKAPSEESIHAIESAWLAATKNNTNWSNMNPQERLDSQAQFRDLRGQIETGELALTENQIMKLNAYATKKKATPTVVRVGALAAGILASIGIMAGPAAAAEQPTPKPTMISANLQNAQLIHKPVGKQGICAEDFTLAKAGKTHKVTWQKPNNQIVKKTMKKGTKACIFTGTNGVAVEASTSADGTILKLPANFPANPTVQDVAALGLTKDSKVDPKLRMGQPTGAPLYTPELADNVEPVALKGIVTQRVESGAGYVTNQYIVVDWEFTGGKGTMETKIPNPSGTGFTQSFVKLNPNGKTIVTTYAPRQTELNEFGEVRYHIQTPLVPDYGQSNLPPSLTQDWELFRQMVNDESGRGVPAAKNANSANPFWMRADPTAPTSGQLYTSPDGLRMV